MKIILFIVLVLTCNLSNAQTNKNVVVSGQDKITSLTDRQYEKEWWFHLIEKHNINAALYTYRSNIKPATDDPKGYTALELGTGATVKDKVLTINDVVFIIRDDDGYSFITAKTATHNLKINRIDWKNGSMKYFKTSQDETEPVQSMTFDDLSYETRTKKMVARKVKGVEPI
jgi:hypothetical protein